jgi:serine protease Do
MAISTNLPIFAADFTDIAESVRRATVQVRGRGPGGGSGVIWDTNGIIVTNAHVARGNNAIVELWDGRVFEATVFDRDAERDLAALKIDARDLPAITIGDSSAVRVGELVLAVGNPFGQIGAVTIGIIHANSTSSHGRKQQWISADIVLAPGNSGGPLVDVQGRVIGINSMIAGGLGLAVPGNDVQQFLRRREQRAPLGVTLYPIPYQGSVALLVLETSQNGAAAAAGIITGDIFIGVNGQRYTAGTDFLAAIRSVKGDELILDIVRGGVSQSVTIRLAVAEAAA